MIWFLTKKFPTFQEQFSILKVCFHGNLSQKTGHRLFVNLFKCPQISLISKIIKLFLNQISSENQKSLFVILKLSALLLRFKKMMLHFADIFFDDECRQKNQFANWKPTQNKMTIINVSFGDLKNVAKKYPYSRVYHHTKNMDIKKIRISVLWKHERQRKFHRNVWWHATQKKTTI